MSSLDYWLPFIGIAGGYVFGAMLTWLLLRNRLNTTRARLQERLRGAEKHAAELEAGAANLEQEIAQIRKSEGVVLQQIGSLEGLLAAERKISEEKAQLLNKAEERMLDSFRIVTRECLAEGQEQLSEQIKTSLLKAHHEKEEAKDPTDLILPLLQPLANSLDRIETRISAIEGERENASQILREQIARVIEKDDAPAPAAAPTPAPMPTRATTLPTQLLPSEPKTAIPPQQSVQPTAVVNDPRPYATTHTEAAKPKTPETFPTKPKAKMSPSTFMEELDTKPFPPSSYHKKTFSTAEVAAAMISKQAPSTPALDDLPAVKLEPCDEPDPKKLRDVLDEDLGDDFVGFEQIASAPKKKVEEIPDPKRAADDLRAALES